MISKWIIYKMGVLDVKKSEGEIAFVGELVQNFVKQ